MWGQPHLERWGGRLLTGYVFPWFIHFSSLLQPFGAGQQSHPRRVRNLPCLGRCVWLLGGKYVAPSKVKSYLIRGQQHVHQLFPPLDGFLLTKENRVDDRSFGLCGTSETLCFSGLILKKRKTETPTRSDLPKAYR